MTELVAFAIVGCGLGLLHSFEPDHLAAMSTLVGRRAQSAIGDVVRGALWGLGHTLALGTLGVALAVTETTVSPHAERTLEAGVGILLVGLGILRLRDAQRSRPVVEPPAARPRHGHTPLWIGILHGAAGSGAVLVLAPAVLLEDPLGYSAYVLGFGLGSILSMAAFCAGLGELLNRLQARVAGAGRWFAATAGSLGIAVGTIWLVQATL